MYTPLLKHLRGHPVMIEVGDETRQAVEVVIGHVWDLFFDDTILLVIVRQDENIEKPEELKIKENADYNAQMAAYQQQKQANPNLPMPKLTAPVPVWVGQEWHLKWVLAKNIIAVKSDGQAHIHWGLRQLTRPKLVPLFDDKRPHWNILNNNLSKRIVQKLVDLKLVEMNDPKDFSKGLKDGRFAGIYRNADNDVVTLEEAAFQVAQAAAPTQIAIPAIPPAAPAAPVQQVPVAAAVATPTGAGATH